MIRLVLFLTVLDICNDEYANPTFKNKKWLAKIKFEYKLG